MPPVTAARDATWAAWKLISVVASFVVLMLTKDIVVEHGLVPLLNTLTAPSPPVASRTGMKEYRMIVEEVNKTSFDLPPPLALAPSPPSPTPPPLPPPPPPPPPSPPVTIAFVLRFLRVLTILIKNVATEIRNWARLIDTYMPGVEPPNTVHLRQSERRGRRWRHHKASLHTKPGVRFPWKLRVVQMPTNGALVFPAPLPALPANITRGVIRYLSRNTRTQRELSTMRRRLQEERRQRQLLEDELAALRQEIASRPKAAAAKKPSFNPAAASFQPSAQPPPPPPPTQPIPRVPWKTGEQTMQSFQRLYPQHGKKMGE
ncbi:MAG: hypothetical protein Q9167_003801 [Letrouitia subvulpina]